MSFRPEPIQRQLSREMNQSSAAAIVDGDVPDEHALGSQNVEAVSCARYLGPGHIVAAGDGSLELIEIRPGFDTEAVAAVAG